MDLRDRAGVYVGELGEVDGADVLYKRGMNKNNKTVYHYFFHIIQSFLILEKSQTQRTINEKYKIKRSMRAQKMKT